VKALVVVIGAMFFGLGASVLARGEIVVGSKAFTEGYILGEVAAQVIEGSPGRPLVQRKLGMGGTGILFEALKKGSIDLYADYTGTVAEAILKNPALKTIEGIRSALRPLGIEASEPLGFDNTYALAVKESFAAAHGLKRVSDLKSWVSTLRAAFSYEFMDRNDRYEGLF